MARAVGSRVEPKFKDASAEAIAAGQAGTAGRGGPSPASRGSTLAQMSHYVTYPIMRALPIAFAMLVLSALTLGWMNSDEGHLTPETGTGYWLGIIGASMMLLLMLYPLRKRARLLRHLGRVPDWFRLHMLLGILGPTMILFHSNFKLGSLNSNVALSVMLVVVASGIVGRFLYARVHKGLYGRKASVADIIGDTAVLKQALGSDLAGAEDILSALRRFETQALSARPGLFRSLGAFVVSGTRARRCRRYVLGRAKAIIAAEAQSQRWSRRDKRARMRIVRKEASLYFAAVTKAARFAVFERLFALWHVLHYPLFFLLIVTAIVHVIAVHLY